jgi:hypothetical protein
MPVLPIGGTGSQVAFTVRRAAQAIPLVSVAWELSEANLLDIRK